MVEDKLGYMMWLKRDREIFRKREMNMKRNVLKKENRKAFAMVLVLGVMLTGCGNPMGAYDDYPIVEQKESELTAVNDVYVDDVYETRQAITEPTLETYASKDGLCVIYKKQDYYDVILDYESGTYEQVGAAYGEVCHEIFAQEEDVLEGYLYENIVLAFPDLEGDYTPVEKRMNHLMEGLEPEYLEEMEAFAMALSDGEKGFVKNGKISYEEACLLQMVPDALRGTACFALSLWGEQTKDHNRYSSRVLEWNTGSEWQMQSIHAVVHMKNHEKSYLSIGYLGILNVLTAINDHGVMIGELDVGIDGANYESEGKKCYTYALRYAVENYDTAGEAADYLVAHAQEYTYSANVLVNDENSSYCVELCTNPQFGDAMVRDENTPLREGYVWDNPDSLCIINDYITVGNREIYEPDIGNTGRFYKMNEWVSEEEDISFNMFKDLLTRDDVTKSNAEGERGKDANIAPIYSENMIHIAVVNYGTHEIEVAFGSPEGAKNKPDFIAIGEGW